MDGFSWIILSPIKQEIFLAVVGMLLLMVGAFRGKTSIGFIMTSVIVAILAAMGSVLLADWTPIDTLNGMVIVDGFSQWMKVLILAGIAGSLTLSVSWLRENDLLKFEYPLLVLFSGVGMLLMVSANNLLSLYVSLELSSLCLYVLAAINRDNLLSSEAGLKYFILGALSSGLLLFGISLVYGYSGTLSYVGISEFLESAQSMPYGVMVGMVFMLAGLAFKVSAVPFHMWTPDVYQGAPTPVTALFAIVPKVAAIGLIIRLLVGPFAMLAQEWMQIIMAVSVGSMLLGAFAGLVQNNIKRLLAYSSIANMGYAMLGLLPNVPEGIAGTIIYLTIYMVMLAGVFAILMSLKRDGKSIENIPDFAGLSKTSPFMAYALTGLLFSMSGIPPLAGFFGKFFVFQAAVAGGYMVVAVIGVLTSVVGAYYYLRLIKVMFFDESAGPVDENKSLSRHLVVVASIAFILLFTVMPNRLLDHALQAAVSLYP
ncbi:MAG: NADH-quinone oxidoreductase subunit N [Alphaproteobacteria bacterium RIFCSPHIGHO2_12_FULL_45_9]|nr:MAG: NADH-quinone oxidoreductase subunit N [Alphaproteobacteria bacterium RIFCSPHIGHO2_02_FULL_46_13]OFW95686.1 MAG: NADH-quinone oxidoreductase subunit N [Alphaproteobacteria bacterium RIFCSPHIGHO2_12_FULL_45_9]